MPGHGRGRGRGYRTNQVCPPTAVNCMNSTKPSLPLSAGKWDAQMNKMYNSDKMRIKRSLYSHSQRNTFIYLYLLTLRFTRIDIIHKYASDIFTGASTEVPSCDPYKC